MANVIRGYVCDGCDEFYESEFEAKDCCRPEVYRAYQCEECGVYHDQKATAEKCCPDYLLPNEHDNDCAA